MSENSKISWTNHTFNIAWGCVEVSPACDHCYAREFSKRMGLDIWGDSPRRTFGEKHWSEPLKWNKKAEKAGKPAYVFCSSMCDIFEAHPTVEAELRKLPSLMERTPFLTWLLLTKRWNEIKRHPLVWRRPNALMGVTVESQTYDFRITPDVEWISAEPLLGDLDLRAYLARTDVNREHGSYGKVMTSYHPGVKWIIIGGESGAGAREMKLDWVLSLIDQARAMMGGVAVHFKQTGDVLARKLGLKDRSGKDPSEWPEKLRIQEFPAPKQGGLF